MKDFNSERRTWAPDQRTFVLGGHQFVARENVRPEVLARYEDEAVGGDKSLTQLLAATDATILSMIEGGDLKQDDGSPVPDSPRARYLALRQDPENVLDLHTLSEVTKWLFEEYTQRPTGAAESSSNGHGSTGTNLTDTSSSPVTPGAATP